MEFNPKDFEDHMKALDKTLMQLMVHRGTAIGEEYFGPGYVDEAVMDRVPANAELWFFKGVYRFYSLYFTDEQKELQRRIESDGCATWTETEAEADAR